MEGPYPEEYIAIQVAYARRISALAHQPLVEALLTQTSLYKMVGAPGVFDGAHPAWRELIVRIDERADATRQTRAIYGYYLQRHHEIATQIEDRHWGCFAYDCRPARRAIRIHFLNQDAPEPGALSRQRMAARLAELRAMFAVARDEQPDAEFVIGASWLYNLEAYRRLFPPAFGASARPTEPAFQYRALWGQFLRSDWSLHTARADEFLGRVATLTDPAQAASCFPFQVLQTQAPIAAFYAFYGV